MGINKQQIYKNCIHANKYFIECIKDITCDSKIIDYYHQHLSDKNLQFILSPVDQAQIYEVVEILTLEMIKICLPFCMDELCHIINESLTSGKVLT